MEQGYATPMTGRELSKQKKVRCHWQKLVSRFTVHAKDHKMPIEARLCKYMDALHRGQVRGSRITNDSLLKAVNVSNTRYYYY